MLLSDQRILLSSTLSSGGLPFNGINAASRVNRDSSVSQVILCVLDDRGRKSAVLWDLTPCTVW
jgi:hypothetical protein